MCLENMIQNHLNLKPDSAKNGLEAKELVIKRTKCKVHENFKLIIMDINMPILTGNEAVDQIREFEKQTNLLDFHYILGSSAVSQEDFWK
jgi:CheY-like chemotaxis protein